MKGKVYADLIKKEHKNKAQRLQQGALGIMGEYQTLFKRCQAMTRKLRLLLVVSIASSCSTVGLLIFILAK